MSSTDPAINPDGWTIGSSGGHYSLNIDHVYEVQLLNIFFYIRIMETPKSPYLISSNDISKAFGPFDGPSHSEFDTRLNVPSNKLASYDKSEFLGVSQIQNTKKVETFTYKFKGDAPMAIPKDLSPVNTIAQLAQMVLTLNMLQKQSMWSLFETTSFRIYEDFQRVDQIIQYRANHVIGWTAPGIGKHR